MSEVTVRCLRAYGNFTNGMRYKGHVRTTHPITGRPYDVIIMDDEGDSFNVHRREDFEVLIADEEALPVFRVIVAGSRDFNNYVLMRDSLHKILSEKVKTHKILIVSGTARGADKLGEEFALDNYFRIDRYPADWSGLGKKAGYVRNRQMAEVADACVVFWDGLSPGTKGMIEVAKEKNLLLRVIRY